MTALPADPFTSHFRFSLPPTLSTPRPWKVYVSRLCKIQRKSPCQTHLSGHDGGDAVMQDHAGDRTDQEKSATSDAIDVRQDKTGCH